MDRAGRLASVEQRQQEGESRVHRRRHRQAGQHLHRKKYEQHDEIGQLLDDVVALGLLALRKAQRQVLPDRRAEVPIWSRDGITRNRSCPPNQPVDQVGDAVQDEGPGEEEVQERPPVRSWSLGKVAQAGNPRSAASPLEPPEEPSHPVVSKA